MPSPLPSLGTFQQPRVATPRSSGDDSLLLASVRQLTDSHNAEPIFSWFSGTTPTASNVTGTPRMFAINIAPSSVGSMLWMKNSGNTTSGWSAII